MVKRAKISHVSSTAPCAMTSRRVTACLYSTTAAAAAAVGKTTWWIGHVLWKKESNAENVQ